ncbi:MAG: hypothetical protein ABUK01_05235 [Leptospirales bacterium]
MVYKIRESNADRTILVPSKTMGIIIFIIKVIGLIFLLPGLLVLFSEEPLDNIVFILSGIGLTFFVGGSMASSYASKLPGKMVFNNTLGKLQIFDKIGKFTRREESAFLSYNEIANFGIRKIRFNNSVSYGVYLEKKDAAIWDLFQSNSENKAREFLQQVENNIDFRPKKDKNQTDVNQGAVIGFTTDSENYKIEKTDTKATIIWRRKLELFNTLSMLVFLFGFTLVFYSAKDEMEQVGRIIAFIFLAVVNSLVLWGIFVSLFSRFHLTIEPNEITYTKFFLKKPVKTAKIESSILHSVLFHFNVSSGHSAIFLLTAEQNQMLSKINKGEAGLGDVFAAFKAHKGSLKIYGTSLSFSEKVRLEKTIQSLITEITGRQNL